MTVLSMLLLAGIVFLAIGSYGLFLTVVCIIGAVVALSLVGCIWSWRCRHCWGFFFQIMRNNNNVWYFGVSMVAVGIVGGILYGFGDPILPTQLKEIFFSKNTSVTTSILLHGRLDYQQQLREELQKVSEEKKEEWKQRQDSFWNVICLWCSSEKESDYKKIQNDIMSFIDTGTIESLTKAKKWIDANKKQVPDEEEHHHWFWQKWIFCWLLFVILDFPLAFADEVADWCRNRAKEIGKTIKKQRRQVGSSTVNVNVTSGHAPSSAGTGVMHSFWQMLPVEMAGEFSMAALTKIAEFLTKK